MPIYCDADGEILKLQSVVVPRDGKNLSLWKFTLASAHTLGRGKGLPELQFWPCELWDFTAGSALAVGDILKFAAELKKTWHGPERSKRWSTSLVVREIKAHTRAEITPSASDQGGPS